MFSGIVEINPIHKNGCTDKQLLKRTITPAGFLFLEKDH
jgi:hypothetical protein